MCGGMSYINATDELDRQKRRKELLNKGCNIFEHDAINRAVEIVCDGEIKVHIEREKCDCDGLEH